ncbi:MAG: hypothetical protein JWQ44_2212 [Chthoniobacter sp.]|jgi:phage shock protein E|nr:hypothetical protein [Chthoniobacter sp.]
MKMFPLFVFVLLGSIAMAADEAKPATTAAAKPPQNVTPEAAEKLLKDNPKIIVLDVRTSEEFKAGHIPGAKNLDFQAPDFAQKVAALDEKQTYLVHCAAGGRSAQAVDLMDGRKLPNLYHLNEGFKAWQKAGKPVEKK